ncbi:MAG TPA: hypothetical protein VGB06_04755 [Solirubrobacterales bacterium]|jgi:hypothetical protein
MLARIRWAGRTTWQWARSPIFLIAVSFWEAATATAAWQLDGPSGFWGLAAPALAVLAPVFAVFVLAFRRAYREAPVELLSENFAALAKSLAELEGQMAAGANRPDEAQSRLAQAIQSLEEAEAALREALRRLRALGGPPDVM